MNKWMEDNDIGTVSSIHDAPDIKPAIKQAGSQRPDSYFIDMQVRAIEEMVGRRKAAIENLDQTLLTTRARLEQERESRWKSEGSSSAISLLHAQLEKLKVKHKELKEMSGTSQEELNNIVAGMSALEDTLQMLEVDKSIANTKAHLELLEDLDQAASIIHQETPPCTAPKFATPSLFASEIAPNIEGKETPELATPTKGGATSPASHLGAPQHDSQVEEISTPKKSGPHTPQPQTMQEGGVPKEELAAQDVDVVEHMVLKEDDHSLPESPEILYDYLKSFKKRHGDGEGPHGKKGEIALFGLDEPAKIVAATNDGGPLARTRASPRHSSKMQPTDTEGGLAARTRVSPRHSSRKQPAHIELKGSTRSSIRTSSKQMASEGKDVMETSVEQTIGVQPNVDVEASAGTKEVEATTGPQPVWMPLLKRVSL